MAREKVGQFTVSHEANGHALKIDGTDAFALFATSLAYTESSDPKGIRRVDSYRGGNGRLQGAEDGIQSPNSTERSLDLLKIKVG